MGDQDAAAALRSGVLTDTFRSTGFGPIDLTGKVAVPSLASLPAHDSAPRRSGDARGRARAQQRLDDAEAALGEAREATEEAQGETERARRQHQNLEKEQRDLMRRLKQLDRDLKLTARRGFLRTSLPPAARTSNATKLAGCSTTCCRARAGPGPGAACAGHGARWRAWGAGKGRRLGLRRSPAVHLELPTTVPNREVECYDAVGLG
jgi:hypothetical protein